MVFDRCNGINRGFVARLIGLAIVAAALFFLIRDLSTVDLAYSHAAADAAVEYESDAQAYINEACFTPTGLGQPDCSSKAHEVAREGQRKEQDLAAQNISAWWTKVMGIAAMIGMALSAVGVWLVKVTFDATRKANQIAQDTMNAENRAWIKLDPVCRRIYFTEDMIEAKVEVSVTNTGNSVARNVVIYGSLHSVRGNVDIIAHRFDDLPEPTFPYTDHNLNIWQSDVHELRRQCFGLAPKQAYITDENYRIFLRMVAVYSTIFDKINSRPRMTEIIIELERDGKRPWVYANLPQRGVKEGINVEVCQDSSGGGRIT